MGKHEPEFPPADGHHEPTGAATAPVGPRLAAARSRKKRALVVASAAGLTLAVGGTAAAAVITTGGDPQDATSAADIPQAEPETLVVEEPQESDEQDGEAEGDEDSPVADPQSLSASGSDILEEPEEEEEEPETSSEDSGGSGDSDGGSGEGGTCEASFYGEDFHGSTTANGETFDTQAMTAAHKTLPFDTMVEVTNPNNGSSVTVRINDRGPYIDGRCLDLSTAAFDEIIGTGSGVGQVDWEVVG